ncbi:MAG: NAD(P) transhydrogenase subunit alpha [Sedimentisphaerales bacterium]
MKVFVPREKEVDETRVPLLPADAGKLIKLGAELEVEATLGKSIGISDKEYKAAGSKISSGRSKSMSGAQIVLRIGPPGDEDIKNLRTTIAQKMDVLSSQANLAGYVAVILGAERLKKIFPMMMTAAGTISPVRVFIIGAGVAGLQAIATAKRLGARVDAFDVRPEAQEQIVSLGARPLQIDIGETGQTKEGYAKQLTDEQIEKQRQAMAKQCAASDIVITTAKVFGKKAPLIVTNKMLDEMKQGSIVIDLAADTGGNVEASESGSEIERKGVTIIGLPELQRRVPLTASTMFSSNIYNFVEHFWDKERKTFVLNREDEILKDCLITHDGEIVNPMIKEIMK